MVLHTNDNGWVSSPQQRWYEGGWGQQVLRVTSQRDHNGSVFVVPCQNIAIVIVIPTTHVCIYRYIYI
eukprot:m.126365 g.126365  ORF g.126365 m.126365 type:complete len:68 (-) comp29198_c2_seq1:83-286(-)